jgi:hypothetical protein
MEVWCARLELARLSHRMQYRPNRSLCIQDVANRRLKCHICIVLSLVHDSLNNRKYLFKLLKNKNLV